VKNLPTWGGNPCFATAFGKYIHNARRQHFRQASDGARPFSHMFFTYKQAVFHICPQKQSLQTAGENYPTPGQPDSNSVKCRISCKIYKVPSELFPIIHSIHTPYYDYC
jgi:hypothetical protein